MSFLNPEYKFTCERCGHEWYMTRREISEAHRAKENAAAMRIQRFTTLSTKKTNNLTSQIALLERTAFDDKKCPACGSKKISKEKA